MPANADLFVAAGGGRTFADGVADGSSTGVFINPVTVPIAGLPFNDEDTNWHVLVGYRFDSLSDRWALELRYDQHKVQVLDVESLSLSLEFFLPL